LTAQFLEEVPIAPLLLIADRACQMAHQVRDYAIIIEQRVIDVEEENDFLGGHMTPFCSVF